jgi:uroporphyrinogen-III synthase
VAEAAAAAGRGKYAGRRVVLTREDGKNGDMLKRLEARGITCTELPLIEHTHGAVGPGPAGIALPTMSSTRIRALVC